MRERGGEVIGEGAWQEIFTPVIEEGKNLFLQFSIIVETKKKN